MRRWVMLAAMVVALWPGMGWGAQTLLDTDGFSGTNGTVLPTYDTNWTDESVSTDDLTIRGCSGSCGAGGSGANLRVGQTWTNNQWAEITVDASTLSDGTVGVFVRHQQDTTLSGYFCGFNKGSFGNDYRIIHYENATGTTLQFNAQVPALGDVINCEIDGNIIILRVNSAVMDTHDITGDGQTDWTTGVPGLVLTHSVSTTRTAGTWRAGSITGSIAGTMLLLGVGK